MKLAILISGPNHNELRWLDILPNTIEIRRKVDDTMFGILIEKYTLCIRDDYIGIYYYNLTALQAKQIQNQATELQRNFGEIL